MEKMNSVIEHQLEFERTFSYFKEILEGGNELSLEILQITNFNQGNFYTLLPQNADFSKIYNFYEGHILNYGEQINNNKFEWVVNLDKKICDFIYNKIKESESLACVFEEVIRNKNDHLSDEITASCSAFFTEKNVYYFLNSNSLSYSLINSCISNANSIWHFLCVLTDYQYNMKKKEIDLADIHNIVLGAHIIIVGAYDREGYVIWEKMS